MVSFTLLLLNLRGNNPWYHLYGRLGGTQSQSGRYGEEKNPYPYRELNPDSSVIRARSLAAIPTEVFCHGTHK
jgi:hypothetical protein